MEQNRTMMVSVNGEMQERRIAGIETNHDILRDIWGLEALNEPVRMIRAIPETFEGERLIWVMDGSCFIVGPSY